MVALRKRVWVAFALPLTASSAWAIPSPVAHQHDINMVLWKEPGSPALPWTNAVADQWNHNHLTPDPFNNGAHWLINKAWDNRTLHWAVTAPGGQFGHGLIEAATPVRFGWNEAGVGIVAIPAAAKTSIDADYGDWVTQATAQYNLRQHAGTVFAMAFTQATTNGTGPKEITIQFQTNYETTNAAYAAFAPGSATLTFEPAPYITLATGAANERIREKTKAGGANINVVTPWNYTNNPALFQVDLEYSDDNGTTWADLPQAGFHKLGYAAGTFHAAAIDVADTVGLYEMDFNTIAKHEIGHTIALNHTGNNTAPIMEDNIADRAYGGTQGIDAESALAAAIDYTYTVPEPASLMLLGMGSLAMYRRRGRA